MDLPAPVTDKASNSVPAGDLDSIAIKTIRTLAIEGVEKAQSGHAGVPMGLAPVSYTLWSAGHESMLLYALLHLAGVQRPDGRPAVSLGDIETFRELNSVCPGHPEYGHTVGVETTTSSLGQGVGYSVGMAMAERWLAARFNRPGHEVFDYCVYSICSNGDLMEGVSGEAASIAGHLKLSNLCWIYDDNTVTIEGHTDLTFSEDVATRFHAYGWATIGVDDANDCEAPARAIEQFQATPDRPTLILVRSIIGYGSPNKQGTSKARSDPLGAEEVKLTKQAYGWPQDGRFLLPDGVRQQFDRTLGARSAKQQAAWTGRLEAYRQSCPDLAVELDELLAGETPDGWDAHSSTFAADEQGVATRVASGKILNAIAPRLPWLIGGSADPPPSTKTHLDFEGAGEFQPQSYGGRNVCFGVREHVMGAIANGLALSGLRPYIDVSLIFSDYMRPPTRLAALMKVPVVFVFSHDSIGLGHDGPTHQPIEQLAVLRAIPGLITLRPADANETTEAWRVILTQTENPACLVLSRQALPTVDRKTHGAASGVARGSYFLAEAEGGEAQIILIGSGREVSLCLAAPKKLGALSARVVSVPSFDLFENQPRDYRDDVLPPKIAARVAVETASPLGWDRYVGSGREILAMRSFGASAPAEHLMGRFDFTVQAVRAAAQRQIAQEDSHR